MYDADLIGYDETEAEADQARGDAQATLDPEELAATEREGHTDRRGDHHHPGNGAQPEDEEIQNRPEWGLDGGENEERHRRGSGKPVDDADDERSEKTIGRGAAELPVDPGEGRRVLRVRMRLRDVAVRMRMHVVAMAVGM